jgi:hypothetical protein
MDARDGENVAKFALATSARDALPARNQVQQHPVRKLLHQHGHPKTARFYPGDHMGITPDTFSTIYAWIADRLGLG